jgi:hypothetical protein
MMRFHGLVLGKLRFISLSAVADPFLFLASWETEESTRCELY